MASVSNLFGLVNQLQTMEQSLTDLLMEMVAKLGNLTDANVFLLVETQEGRKISGHRQLCQQYLEGSLAPVGADVLFDVDTSFSPVRPVGCFDRGVDGNFVEMQTCEEEASKKKHFQHRKRRGSGNGGGGGGEEGGADHLPKLRRMTPQQQRQQSETAVVDPDVVVVKMERHAEIMTDDVVPITADNREGSLSSGNEEIAIDSMDGGGVNETLNASLVNDHSNNSSSGLAALRRGSSSAVTSASYYDDDDGDLFDAVNSKLAAQKMDALKCISGENAFSRGTVENRLSTSLCYDFGKTLADFKPFHLTDSAQIKTFFNVHFEKWIHQFVNLSPFFQKSVSNGRPEGGQTFTFLGLLRQCARTAFFQRVARNKKT